MKLARILGLFGLALMGPFADAQDMSDGIVVSAMRVVDSETAAAQSLPHVTLRVPADFVLFEASFVNADVNLARREQDLKSTFNLMLAADRERRDVELAIGDADESYPIESATFEEAYNAYGQRGSYAIAMRVDVRPGDSYDDVRDRADGFLKAIKEIGRVQYVIDDDQYIGLRNPERFRPDLMAAISADIDAMSRQFSGSEVTVYGLESKTITRPTGALSLDVYVPYSYTLVSTRRE